MATREYNNDYPSVTQVLGMLRKLQLELWFKYNSYKVIEEKSKKGLAIGSVIHKAIQTHIDLDEIKIETEYPDEVLTCIKSFMLFKKENPDIKLQRSEVQGTSEIYRFNWTLDCLGFLRDEILIFDWKSGECKDKDKPVIYHDSKYQVSAYVKAYNENYNANIRRACIVAIAKNNIAYNIEFLESNYINETFYELFLPALSICNLKKRRGE